MSLIKSQKEMEALREGGARLSRVLREVRSACVVGADTEQLDRLARQRIEEAGGTPSFLGHRISPKDPAYPGALCVSINDEVVHGLAIPSRTLSEGDVVGLDIGMWYQGLCTDMATTVIVGEVSDDGKVNRAMSNSQAESARQLVTDTRESLVRALQVVRNGAFVSEIGASVEDFLQPRGYGIVKDLVGHGVGHAVHEEPSIPNYRERAAKPFELRTGMVIAIEPMVTLGTWRVKMKKDGWTIATADGSLAAHFEVTVAVTDAGYELLTPWPDLD